MKAVDGVGLASPQYPFELGEQSPVGDRSTEILPRCWKPLGCFQVILVEPGAPPRPIVMCIPASWRLCFSL